MQDLLEINPVYTMLPLDEEVFEINADTRTIKVPASFSKSAGMQKDHMAEMIVFTIDRYFDYMDLANTTIYVQWTAGNVEGASLVHRDLYDLETIPGKIRFGWPLTSNITANPGLVKFSVRFFRANENKEVVYSFNTLTAEITIKPSLQPEINADANVDSPMDDNLFKNAIVNSMYAAEGVTLPMNPEFGNPGLNLPETASLVDNTLTLRAQAVVRDTGIIGYTWYHKSLEEDAVWENCAEIGTVGEEYEEVTPAGRLLKETYYTDGAEGKEVYFGNIPAAEGVKLYEKYTTYTVPAEGVVTGTYQVRATNSVGGNITQPVNSNECVLPAPGEVVFSENLASSAIIPEGSSVELKVGAIADKANPAISYKWEKSVTSATEGFETLEDVTAAYAVVAPGWYKATINSQLNRNTKSAVSGVCKATFLPAVPVLAREATESWADANEATINFNKDDIVELKVSCDLAEAGPLYSEDIEYIWKFQASNGSDFRVLGESDIASGLVQEGLNTNTLKIKCLIDPQTSSTFYNFECRAVNKLNGKESAVSEAVTFQIL